MRVVRGVLVGVVLVGASACGGSDGPPPVDQAALDDWTAREQFTPPTKGTKQSRTLGAGREPNAQPAPAGVDVGADGSFAFRRAPLTDALRFLAERAGLQLVANELSGEVTQELRDVSPREALEIIAWQHHVELEFQGRTVLARQAR